MNNYILVNRTFCETTPESAQDSEFSNSGFIEQDMQVSFRELVDLMKGHLFASCSPDRLNDLTVWYSTEFYTYDYRTGTDRECSLHYSSNNTTNAAKYWFLARKIAIKKKELIIN